MMTPTRKCLESVSPGPVCARARSLFASVGGRRSQVVYVSEEATDTLGVTHQRVSSTVADLVQTG